jgi:hypothetical protein
MYREAAPMADAKPTLLERAQRAEQRGNREVRDLWDRYQGHRQHVTAALLELAPPAGGRLCLLGAGNANDLDLELLAARFDEVHLVDLDPGALSRATGRQNAATRSRLRSHAPVDLSGLYQQLERKVTAPDALVEAGVTAVLRQLPADCDVVASCCVLSQMSWALENLVPGSTLPLELLQQTLVRIHLRVLAGAIRPTGAALLLADLVASSVYPLDELPPDADLAAVAQRLAAERIAYPVSNPDLLRQVLRHDATLAAQCQPLRARAPWLWAGPNEQTYLVCPLVLQKRS